MTGSRYKSPVMEHMDLSGHVIRESDVSILAYEPNWEQRGIREAYFIRALTPSLNRDLGRHDLPPIYDPIIKSTVKPPPRPRPHDTSPRAQRRQRGRPRRAPAEAVT